MTTRYELMQILEAKFPLMWMKPAEEFDGSAWGKKCIWTGEGSSMSTKEYGNIGIFNYDTDNTIYEMGVVKELVAVLDEHEYYAEWLDGGTVFISPS